MAPLTGFSANDVWRITDGTTEIANDTAADTDLTNILTALRNTIRGNSSLDAKLINNRLKIVKTAVNSGDATPELEVKTEITSKIDTHLYKSRLWVGTFSGECLVYNYVADYEARHVYISVVAG